MGLHAAEEATFRAFVISAKRERIVSLFGSAKRRKEALDTLKHFPDWDKRLAREIPSSTDVLTLLRGAGARAECHLISDDVELDGRDLPLENAVSAAEACDFATVLCCVPGKLAFFFDETEAPRRRLILSRS